MRLRLFFFSLFLTAPINCSQPRQFFWNHPQEAVFDILTFPEKAETEALANFISSARDSDTFVNYEELYGLYCDSLSLPAFKVDLADLTAEVLSSVSLEISQFNESTSAQYQFLLQNPNLYDAVVVIAAFQSSLVSCQTFLLEISLMSQAEFVLGIITKFATLMKFCMINLACYMSQSAPIAVLQQLRSTMYSLEENGTLNKILSSYANISNISNGSTILKTYLAKVAMNCHRWARLLLCKIKSSDEWAMMQSLDQTIEAMITFPKKTVNGFITEVDVVMSSKDIASQFLTRSGVIPLHELAEYYGYLESFLMDDKIKQRSFYFPSLDVKWLSKSAPSLSTASSVILDFLISSFPLVEDKILKNIYIGIYHFFNLLLSSLEFHSQSAFLCLNIDVVLLSLVSIRKSVINHLRDCVSFIGNFDIRLFDILLNSVTFNDQASFELRRALHIFKSQNSITLSPLISLLFSLENILWAASTSNAFLALRNRAINASIDFWVTLQIVVSSQFAHLNSLDLTDYILETNQYLEHAMIITFNGETVKENYNESSLLENTLNVVPSSHDLQVMKKATKSKKLHEICNNFNLFSHSKDILHVHIIAHTDNIRFVLSKRNLITLCRMYKIVADPSIKLQVAYRDLLLLAFELPNCSNHSLVQNFILEIRSSVSKHYKGKKSVEQFNFILDSHDWNLPVPSVRLQEFTMGLKRVYGISFDSGFYRYDPIIQNEEKSYVKEKEKEELFEKKEFDAKKEVVEVKNFDEKKEAFKENHVVEDKAAVEKKKITEEKHVVEKAHIVGQNNSVGEKCASEEKAVIEKEDNLDQQDEAKQLDSVKQSEVEIPSMFSVISSYYAKNGDRKIVMSKSCHQKHSAMFKSKVEYFVQEMVESTARKDDFLDEINSLSQSYVEGIPLDFVKIADLEIPNYTIILHNYCSFLTIKSLYRYLGLSSIAAGNSIVFKLLSLISKHKRPLLPNNRGKAVRKEVAFFQIQLHLLEHMMEEVLLTVDESKVVQMITCVFLKFFEIDCVLAIRFKNKFACYFKGDIEFKTSFYGDIFEVIDKPGILHNSVSPSKKKELISHLKIASIMEEFQQLILKHVKVVSSYQSYLSNKPLNSLSRLMNEKTHEDFQGVKEMQSYLEQNFKKYFANTRLDYTIHTAILHHSFCSDLDYSLFNFKSFYNLVIDIFSHSFYLSYQSDNNILHSALNGYFSIVKSLNNQSIHSEAQSLNDICTKCFEVLNFKSTEFAYLANTEEIFQEIKTMDELNSFHSFFKLFFTGCQANRSCGSLSRAESLLDIVVMMKYLLLHMNHSVVEESNFIQVYNVETVKMYGSNRKQSPPALQREPAKTMNGKKLYSFAELCSINLKELNRIKLCSINDEWINLSDELVKSCCRFYKFLQNESQLIFQQDLVNVLIAYHIPLKPIAGTAFIHVEYAVKGNVFLSMLITNPDFIRALHSATFSSIISIHAFLSLFDLHFHAKRIDIS